MRSLRMGGCYSKPSVKNSVLLLNSSVDTSICVWDTIFNRNTSEKYNFWHDLSHQSPYQAAYAITNIGGLRLQTDSVILDIVSGNIPYLI